MKGLQVSADLQLSPPLVRLTADRPMTKQTQHVSIADKNVPLTFDADFGMGDVPRTIISLSSNAKR